MSVSTVSLGTNTSYVHYTYNENPQTIFDQVCAVILENGWELCDDISSVAKVFKSQNDLEDDIKYFKLSLVDEVDNNSLAFEVFEYWDNSIHVGANQVASLTNRKTVFDTRYGGAIYIFRNVNYMYISSRIANQSAKQGTLVGVGGFLPFNDYHAGVPNFGYLDSQLMFGHHMRTGFKPFTLQNKLTNSSISNYAQGYNGLCVPRNTQGSLGIHASSSMAIEVAHCDTHISRLLTTRILSVGEHTCSPTNTTYYFGQDNVHLTIDANNGNFPTKSAWKYVNSQCENRLFEQVIDGVDQQTGLPFVYTPYVKEMTWNALSKLVSYRGRMYGFKVLSRNRGSFGNVCSIPVDDKLMIDPENGTPTDHILVTHHLGDEYVALALPL